MTNDLDERRTTAGKIATDLPITPKGLNRRNSSVRPSAIIFADCESRSPPTMLAGRLLDGKEVREAGLKPRLEHK